MSFYSQTNNSDQGFLTCYDSNDTQCRVSFTENNNMIISNSVEGFENSRYERVVVKYFLKNWKKFHKHYAKLNPDLEGLGIKTERELRKHFIVKGRKEGRKVTDEKIDVNEIKKNMRKQGNSKKSRENFLVDDSLEYLEGFSGKSEKELNARFVLKNWDLFYDDYLANNEDLSKKGLDKRQAFRHYKTRGYKEDRKVTDKNITKMRVAESRKANVVSNENTVDPEDLSDDEVSDEDDEDDEDESVDEEKEETTKKNQYDNDDLELVKDLYVDDESIETPEKKCFFEQIGDGFKSGWDWATNTRSLIYFVIIILVIIVIYLLMSKMNSNKSMFGSGSVSSTDFSVGANLASLI